MSVKTELITHYFLQLEMWNEKGQDSRFTDEEI